MKDSRNSIWSACLCKNKAASCVFMWLSKWDRVSPSGGHSLGPRQNHFPVSGHMITQDDLSKKESFKDAREINHVYFSSGYAGAFPWKIVPMPCLDGKILNESVSWRHPEGDGVFLTGKATREPSRNFVLFLLQLLSGLTAELESPVWENKIGLAWNIDF